MKGHVLRATADFNQTWHKAFLGDGNSDFLSELPRPFQREDKNKLPTIQQSSSLEPLG